MQPLMAHADDDVAEAVLPAMQLYVQHLRQLPALTAADRARVASLLTACLAKMRYDETFNFDREGEAEVEFLEYRATLKTVFDNVALLDASVVLGLAVEVVPRLLEAGRAMDQACLDAELALHIVFLVGTIAVRWEYRRA